jgi:hypothetical protein
MKRWAQITCRLSCAVLCIFGILFFVLFFTKKNWRVHLTNILAVHYQHLPKNIDTVEVFTLEDDPSGNPYGFIGDLSEGIVGHKTLTGSDADKIVDLWGQFPIGLGYQAMCFDPAYGLQFKRNGKIYFQSAVCWHCSAFTIDVPFTGTTEYGFDSKSEGAQKLLDTLEKYLPLPPAQVTEKKN